MADEAKIAKLLNKGLGLQQAGRRREARQVYQKLLKAAPGQADALHLLGVLALEEGRLTEAARMVEQALRARPRDPAFLSNMGLIRRRQGRPEEAIACFQKALAVAPTFANAFLPYGECLAATGKPRDAIPVLEAAVKAAPRSVRALTALAAALTAARRTRAAADVLRQALRLRPDHLPALLALRDLPAHVLRAGEALEVSARAVTAAPDDAAILGRHAVLCEHANRLDEAETAVQRALTLSPAEPEALLVQARLAHRRGDDAAAECALTRLEAQAEATETTRAMAAWLRAQIADRRGTPEEAVAAMTRAHELNLSSAQGRAADGRVVLDRIAWFARWARGQPPADVVAAEADSPVFFVGFPRSGTTLMEQVLAAHPGLATTMEEPLLTNVLADLPDLLGRPFRYPQDLPSLTPAECATAAREYMARVHRSLGGEAAGRRIVDKLPLNLIELPAVARLFPGAPVIVALRDPRDVVVSAFMQLFVPNPAMRQLAGVESAARFYDSVMSLLPLYREVLGLPLLTYRYEDLIDDFDGTVAQVLEFLELPWADTVREYAAQAQTRHIATPSYADVVKAPHAGAIGRWRRYAQALAPVLPILTPWVERFGYPQK